MSNTIKDQTSKINSKKEYNAYKEMYKSLKNKYSDYIL